MIFRRVNKQTLAIEEPVKGQIITRRSAGGKKPNTLFRLPHTPVESARNQIVFLVNVQALIPERKIIQKLRRVESDLKITCGHEHGYTLVFGLNSCVEWPVRHHFHGRT